MQEIMATVSGADATSVKLLTSSLSFAERRDALFKLLSHRAVPLDQTEQIRRTYGYPPHSCRCAMTLLIRCGPREIRNGSTAGPASDGLTAVKPLHDIGGQKETFVEDDADKITYTLDDLSEISQRLILNHSGMEAYAVGVGLARSR